MIRKLAPILGITFIDIIGFSMLFPILPYFVTHFGMSAVVVGILLSTFSLCQLISGPIWGNVSDRVGRKDGADHQPNRCDDRLGDARVCTQHSWVFIARIVEGISGGNIGITQAYVADLVEPKQRAKAFGYISATFAAGMVFGPAGGGLLYSKFGFAAPFLAASALQLLTLVLTVILLPESRSKKQEDEEHVGMREIFTTFTNARFSPLLLQKLALSLALYGWYSVIALYLAGQVHFGVVATTQYFSFFAIINVVINGVGVGKASNRLGDRVMSIAWASVTRRRILCRTVRAQPLHAHGRHDPVRDRRRLCEQRPHRHDFERGDGARTRYHSRRLFLARFALGNSLAAALDRTARALRLPLCERRIARDVCDRARARDTKLDARA